MTVTAQAGVNGRRLEAELNARGLMLPHYPASVEWATVGGYIAARGSGVLSTRYGKIEDLLLVAARRDAGDGPDRDGRRSRATPSGPELTQLFVGSEGTLGVITRATLQLVPVPAERRFAAVAFPSVGAGIDAIRRTLQSGHRPSVVRMYDEDATRLAFAPVVGEDLSGVYTVLAFEGEPEAVEVEERRTLEIAAEAGAELLDPSARASAGGTGATTSTTRRTSPSCRRSGARSTSSRPTRASRRSTRRCTTAVRVPYADTGLELRMHFSHWYPWGTMIYGRFVVPDGGPDALALHDRIWEDGMTAALDAGGVMNDHHGVGIKLGPYMRRQHGGALDAMRLHQGRARPQQRHEPRKDGPLGPRRRRPMAFKVAMHNWMRAEPIETTITRLGRSGYDGIEISGEPAIYDADEVKGAARPERPLVLGLGDADDRRPRPRPRGPLRPPGERAVRQGLPVVRRLARRRHPHGRAVDGRQGHADGLARGGVGLVRRGPQGVPGARRGGRRPHRRRAAQPLRDLLHQPRRPGRGDGQGGRRQLRRRARHLPHEHRGGRLAPGDPRHRRLPGRLPRRRQQPDASGPGRDRLGGARAGAQPASATTAT